MEPSAFEKRKIEIIILWTIPSLSLFVSFLFWCFQNRLMYWLYLLLTPTIFVGIFIGIAVRFFKLWQWQTSILSFLVPLQRPLIYASYFSLVFVLASPWLTLPTSLYTVISTAFVVGLIGMLVGVVHDLFGVDVGLYKIAGRRFDRDIHGTLLVVSRYAFYFFGSVGFFLGLAAKLGYYFIYENAVSYSPWILSLIAGAIISFPFVLWAFSQYRVLLKKQKSHSA